MSAKQGLYAGALLASSFGTGWFAKKRQVTKQIYQAETTIESIKPDKLWPIMCTYRNALGIYVASQLE